MELSKRVGDIRIVGTGEIPTISFTAGNTQIDEIIEDELVNTGDIILTTISSTSSCWISKDRITTYDGYFRICFDITGGNASYIDCKYVIIR